MARKVIHFTGMKITLNIDFVLLTSTHLLKVW